MMLTAGIIGVLSVAGGLMISFHAGTSGSATMALIPIILFFIVLTTKTLLHRSPAQEMDDAAEPAPTGS
jgi:manganese/iron transport system permease protein